MKTYLSASAWIFLLAASTGIFGCSSSKKSTPPSASPSAQPVSDNQIPAASSTSTASPSATPTDGGGTITLPIGTPSTTAGTTPPSSGTVDLNPNPVGPVIPPGQPLPAGVCQSQTAPGMARMFRLQNNRPDPSLPDTDPRKNQAQGNFLFTYNFTECNNAVRSGNWVDQSANPTFWVYNVQQQGMHNLKRVRNPSNGQHYLTLNLGEWSTLVNLGWVDEGDVGFLYPIPTANNAEVFHLQNIDGNHLFTASASLRDAILSQYQGVWTRATSLGWGPSLP